MSWEFWITSGGCSTGQAEGYIPAARLVSTCNDGEGIGSEQ
jgi:hypothetical protein